MAIPIEAYSVVVRNSTVAAKYPGGMGAYERDCPNNTFCSDEHLCRIGFMVRRDAEHFVAQLAARGLTPYRDNAAEDVVLVRQADGPLVPCDWLELGRYQGALIAWLAGVDVGDLHVPHGWTPERQMQQVSAEAKEQLEFIRTENSVD